MRDVKRNEHITATISTANEEQKIDDNNCYRLEQIEGDIQH